MNTDDLYSAYNKITEGKATVLSPKSSGVFYNPVQQFNRDLSVAAIHVFKDIYETEYIGRAQEKGIRLSIRYSSELPT